MSTTQLMSKSKFEEPEAKELALTEPEAKTPRVSEKITSASNVSVALPEDPNRWTIDDVYRWSIESVGISEQSALILKNQEVDGKALLTLTEEELVKHPCNMPGGPATLVAMAIQNLKKKFFLPEIVTRGKVLGSSLQLSTITLKPDWVDRRDIKETIDNLFDQQMSAYKFGNRVQDFRFWVIAGGSGIGKTRTGQELPRLLAEKLKNNNAHSVHTFIHADLCPLQFPLKNVGGTDNARIPDNMDQAGKWLSLGIAAWYFAHDWSYYTLRMFQRESEAFSDFFVVIKAIRLSEQMKGVLQEDQTLVLFLQIDEFQRNIPLVRAALRFIRGFFLDLRNIKVLMVPILTGTYPLGIEELQKNYVTDYVGNIITLPPLSQQESENLLRAALSLHNKPYPSDDHPTLPFYKMLLSYMGGIPHFIVKCAAFLPSDLSQLADKIWQKHYYHAIRMNLELTYGDRQLWLPHFGSESAVITFLKMAWFREHVTRDTTLNGKTIGDLEESGLIYLERTSNEIEDAFIIAVPPILLLTIDRALNFKIFQEILIEGLVQLSPDNFPDVVMAMHKATYQILWLSKPSDQPSVQITIRKIYNDAAEGNSQLNQQVSITSEPIIVNARKNITDLTNVYIREQNTSIDATKGTYLIATERMASDLDGILPHGFEQYMWSAHLTEGQKNEVTSGKKRDPKLWPQPKWIKKEYSKCDKMCPNTITALRPFVMISPKPYQGLYNELPPNTLLVCGCRALMKFGRGFLSDCAYPLDETQKRWEAVGDQLYNELKEWMCV